MDLFRKIIDKEFVRYLCTGVINTVFSFVSFVGFMELIGIKEIAATLNLIVCVCFNYFMYSKFVYKEKRTLKQLVRFYMIYFVTYIIGLVHLFITVDILLIHVYQARLISTLYMPFISYYLQKKIVFLKKN